MTSVQGTQGMNHDVNDTQLKNLRATIKLMEETGDTQVTKSMNEIFQLQKQKIHALKTKIDSINKGVQQISMSISDDLKSRLESRLQTLKRKASVLESDSGGTNMVPSESKQPRLDSVRKSRSKSPIRDHRSSTDSDKDNLIESDEGDHSEESDDV